MLQTRDLAIDLTTGTTTTPQGKHAILLLLSAVDAPFVDSIYGLYVDAVYYDAGDDATNFVEPWLISNLMHKILIYLYIIELYTITT
jgi:hypothetical protein